jgi:hypothetical protein
MTRLFSIALALVACASAANAVTLTVETDKLLYDLGETVHVTIMGNPSGAKDDGIWGRLEYSAALTTTLTSSQTQHTRGGGMLFSLTGALQRGDGFAEVFNQIIDGGGVGRTVDNVQIATATLIADAAGIVEIFWDDAFYGLDFFGLTNASVGSPPNPVASFTIVPEPGTIALLGLGLLALAAGHRLVSPDTQKRPPTL